MSRAARQMPSQEYLRECFSYDPETGVVTWKHRPLSHFGGDTHAMNTFNANYPGRQAKSKHKKGYLTVSLDGVSYLVHRVIWKLVTGQEPKALIDHQNEDKSCNRWLNLREATKRQNGINRGASAASKSGAKGVVWQEERQAFAVYGTREGRTVFIGRFADKADAIAAQRAAETEAHGEFAHQPIGATA